MKYDINHEKQKELEKMNTLFETFSFPDGDTPYINKLDG